MWEVPQPHLAEVPVIYIVAADTTSATTVLRFRVRDCDTNAIAVPAARAPLRVSPPRGFRFRVHPRLGIPILYGPLPRAAERISSGVRPPVERSRQRHVVHVRERSRFF